MERDAPILIPLINFRKPYLDCYTMAGHRNITRMLYTSWGSAMQKSEKGIKNLKKTCVQQ